MTTVKEFSSGKNKGILWDFMLKNKFFNNIPAEKEGDVKKAFESRISELAHAGTDATSVVELNKRLISSILPIFNDMKPTAKKVSFRDEPTIPRDNLNELSDKNVITAEKHQQIRQDMFTKQLAGRQQEFDQMIKSNIPNKVDFSDAPQQEDDHITNMDDRVASMISDREEEISSMFKDSSSQVLQQLKDPVEATSLSPTNILQGLSSRKIGTPNGNGITHVERKPLKIGERTVIKDIILIQISKTEGGSTDAAASLKNDMKEIKEQLRIVLERLDTIKTM